MGLGNAVTSQSILASTELSDSKRCDWATNDRRTAANVATHGEELI